MSSEARAGLARAGAAAMTTGSSAEGRSYDRVVYQIEESWSGPTCQAFCPELDMVGFGDSAEEARSALRSQVIGYLEDCDQMGVLEDVLIDAGFYDDGEVWMSNLVTPVGDPQVRFLGRPADPDDRI